MLHIRKDGEGKISQALLFRTPGHAGYHFFLNALHNTFTTLKIIGEVYPKNDGSYNITPLYRTN
jgi:hypothetical protein